MFFSFLVVNISFFLISYFSIIEVSKGDLLIFCRSSIILLSKMRKNKAKTSILAFFFFHWNTLSISSISNSFLLIFFCISTPTSSFRPIIFTISPIFSMNIFKISFILTSIIIFPSKALSFSSLDPKITLEILANPLIMLFRCFFLTFKSFSCFFIRISSFFSLFSTFSKKNVVSFNKIFMAISHSSELHDSSPQSQPNSESSSLEISFRILTIRLRKAILRLE